MGAADETFQAARAILLRSREQLTPTVNEAFKANHDDLHTITSAIALRTYATKMGTPELTPTDLLLWIKGYLLASFQLGYAAGHADAAKEDTDRG